MAFMLKKKEFGLALEGGINHYLIPSLTHYRLYIPGDHGRRNQSQKAETKIQKLEKIPQAILVIWANAKD